MTKSDLRTGMVVINNYGEKGLVMLNTSDGDQIVSDGGGADRFWVPLDFFDSELTCSDLLESVVEIVEVWSCSYRHSAASLELADRTLLWKKAISG